MMLSYKTQNAQGAVNKCITIGGIKDTWVLSIWVLSIRVLSIRAQGNKQWNTNMGHKGIRGTWVSIRNKNCLQRALSGVILNKPSETGEGMISRSGAVR
jgi:hypothetical protein